MTTITWSELFSDFTAAPWGTLLRLGAVLQENFLARWPYIFLAIFLFWATRTLVFGLVNIVIPARMQETVPRWARTRSLNLWRSKLYRASLDSRAIHRTRSIILLTRSIVDPLMGTVAFLTIMGQLGVVANSVTVSFVLGALTLAFGLGAQGLVKDLLAGLTVVAADVYAVGDYVDMQLGAAGVVKHMGLRLTTLEASDGTIWSVRHSEVTKIGNRTAVRGLVLTDVVLTWNEEGKHVRLEDLKFAETLLDGTVRELAETLEGVERMVKDASRPQEAVPLESIAGVVPDLVPTITADTLWDMKALKEEDLEEQRVQQAVERIPGRVPLFTRVESLGLVGSTMASVTLRLRITLPPQASRSQAFTVLRRAVFEAFVEHDISTQFLEVPEGSIFMSERELTPPPSPTLPALPAFPRRLFKRGKR